MSKRSILRKIINIKRNSVTFMFILAVVIGILTGLGSIGFRYLIDFFKNIFFGHGKDLFSFLGQYYVIIIPAIGGLLVGLLIKFFASEAKGHGVPEVMNAVSNLGGKIRARVVFIKALASSICIGSGGSVGREGPIVQIGSAIGSACGQYLGLTQKQIKNLVACGAAAGISATFNAPIAGVIFALEVILRDFGRFSFGIVVISSVIADVISRSYYGNIPAFVIDSYQLNSVNELFLYAILGIICAIAALLFVHVLSRFEDFFDKTLKISNLLKALIGGLIIGGVGFFFPQIFGVGYETMEQALAGDLPIRILFILIFVKIFATSLTIGSGGSGGVFAPSLFIGAMTGGSLGRLFHTIFPSLPIAPGSYSLVGMGAFFAAAAQAPMSAIIILFELTHDYRMILPLMLACVISTLVYRYLFSESIYTIKLLSKGIQLVKKTGFNYFDSVSVKKVMAKNIETLQETDTIKDFMKKMEKTNHVGFPVLNIESKLVGIVTHANTLNHKSNTKIKDICISDYIYSFPDESLTTAIEKMTKKSIGRLLIVDPDNPTKLIGLVTRKNILSKALT